MHSHNTHLDLYCSAPTYYSPSFYSHPNDYKLQLVAKLVCHCIWCLARFLNVVVIWPIDAITDTNSKICSISVDLYVTNGEYDANLKCPFKREIAVTLLNRQVDKDHIKKEKFYKSEYKSGGISQLQIKQDNDIKQYGQLKAEYRNLLVKCDESSIKLEELWNIYIKMSTN